jgi:type II secretory pathway component PulF
MPQFHYQALNAAQQIVAGSLEAPSVVQAIAQLEAEGLVVQSIGYAAHDAGQARAPRPLDTPRAATAVEPAALQQHLTQVIERTRPILGALRAYAAEMPSGRYRGQFTKMLEIVERGDVQQAAVGAERMPAYWIALLSAATASADFSRILEQFLEETHRADELRRQWRWTMAYPVVIFGLTAAVLTFLSFVPIPIFRDLFRGFGLRLPWLTQMVLETAAWITSGKILVLAMAIAAAGLVLYKATELLPLPFRNWVGDRIGTSFGRGTAIAQFSQFLADLLEAELQIASALRVAGFATKSPRLRRAAWRLAADFDAGSAIDAASYRRTITATVLYALRSDMPQRPRVHLIRELSACYANRAARSLSWTRGVVEPIASVFVGLVAGIGVIALFLPLISLIQGLS